MHLSLLRYSPRTVLPQIPKSSLARIGTIQTRFRTMATAHQIQVAPTDSGLLKFEQDSKTAAEVTALLQKDLENHNVFFNPSGFHNHIVHHLLTLYGTGADIPALQQAFDHNKSYQIRLREPQSPAVEELRADYEAASPQYLGKGTAFPTWLDFFQGEIDDAGGDWQAVLRRYLFADTPAARDLQGRLFGGLLHPIIQLLYGVEWSQPAIVASALAQTAVHRNEIGDIMDEAGARAAARADADAYYMPPLVTLLEEVGTSGQHEKLRSSVHWDDDIKIKDGVLTRAKDEALDLMSRVRVHEDELEERTAEMVHTAAYVATSTALHPPHVPKLDFFLIHHLTSAPIFLSFNKHAWIPASIKTRLLEWKMRLDLVNYVARRSPALQRNLLRTYKPRDTTLVAAPSALLPRFHGVKDDGHTIKVARALLIAQEVAGRYADRDWLRIKDDREWLAAHYLLLDSVNGGGEEIWVRQTGFAEAWESVPEKTW